MENEITTRGRCCDCKHWSMFSEDGGVNEYNFKRVEIPLETAKEMIWMMGVLGQCVTTLDVDGETKKTVLNRAGGKACRTNLGDGKYRFERIIEG